MAVPALLIAAVQSFNKISIFKDIVDILTKKDVDVVDKLLSYIPGFTGKSSRVFKQYHDQLKDFNKRIGQNQKALSNLYKNAMRLGPRSQETRYFKFNEKRLLNNIAKAKNGRDKAMYNLVKTKIKGKIKSNIPGRSFLLSQKELAKAIYNKEGWNKVSAKLGSALANLGFGEYNRVLSVSHKLGNIHVTANGFWRSISINNNSLTPIINASGATKLLKIQQYKDALTERLWDRTFYFEANSPQTQNFSQKLHSYDCVNHTYTIPIRGWRGKDTKEYVYPNVEMNSVLIVIIRRFDAGRNYWNNYATANAKFWAQFYAEDEN